MRHAEGPTPAAGVFANHVAGAVMQGDKGSARRRRRVGFTLIELLIVVVIIGILAAIAIPKFQNTKGKANLAAIKSDLRNLAVAEESYFNENGTYTTNLATLNITPTAGVTITFGTVNGNGWAASATHPQSYPIICYLYMGTVPPMVSGSTEGLVNCQ